MDNRPTMEKELLRGSSDSAMMSNGLMPMMGYPYPPRVPTQQQQHHHHQFPPIQPFPVFDPHRQPAHQFPFPSPSPTAFGQSFLQSPAITGLASSGPTATSRGQLVQAMNLKQSDDEEGSIGEVDFPTVEDFEDPSSPPQQMGAPQQPVDTIHEQEEQQHAVAEMQNTAIQEVQHSTDVVQQQIKTNNDNDVPQDVHFPQGVASLPPDPPPVEPRQQVPEEKPAPRSKNTTGTNVKSKKKDEKWLSTLDELKKYKTTYGNCIVPRGFMENPRLASWVAEQRKQYKLLLDKKQSSITQERIDKLNELGFAWNAQEAAWTRHLEDLKTFKKETGHCHVPLNDPKYPKLGLWVKEQRRHYTLMKQGKQSHMTESRVEELDAVGFCWDTHEATWLERLRELSDYKSKHGNCYVPTNYTANSKLGTWVHHQRRQYKRWKKGLGCHITAERVESLKKLGFVWNPRAGSDVKVHSDTESTVSDCSEDGNPKRSKRQRKR